MPDASSKLSYGILKPLLRTGFVKAVGVKYDESLRLGEDFKFAVELLLRGAKAVMLSRPLYTYFEPVGRISGAASPHSQTDYHLYGPLSEAVGGLRKTYASVISPNLSRSMEKRRIHCWRLHQAGVAGQMRRSRQYVRCLLYLAPRPALVWFLARNAPARAAAIARRLAFRLASPAKR